MSGTKKGVDDVEKKMEEMRMKWNECYATSLTFFFFICYIKNKDSFIHEFLYSEKKGIENECWRRIIKTAACNIVRAYEFLNKYQSIECEKEC